MGQAVGVQPGLRDGKEMRLIQGVWIPNLQLASVSSILFVLVSQQRARYPSLHVHCKDGVERRWSDGFERETV